MFGVTGAGLTAAAARHVPGVGRTEVAVLADYVGEAVALPAAAVTVTVPGRRTRGGVAAQLVTDTFCGGSLVFTQSRFGSHSKFDDSTIHFKSTLYGSVMRKEL